MLGEFGAAGPGNAFANTGTHFDQALAAAQETATPGTFVPESPLGNIPAGASNDPESVKQTGRANARSTTEQEEARWRGERKQLLRLKYSVGLSDAQACRLDFVRWNLFASMTPGTVLSWIG